MELNQDSSRYGLPSSEGEYYQILPRTSSLLHSQSQYQIINRNHQKKNDHIFNKRLNNYIVPQSADDPQASYMSPPAAQRRAKNGQKYQKQPASMFRHPSTPHLDNKNYNLALPRQQPLPNLRTSADYSQQSYNGRDRLTNSGYSLHTPSQQIHGPLNRRVRKLVETARKNRQDSQNQVSESQILLKEFIGIRRSVQNFSYKEICRSSVDDYNQRMCPSCDGKTPKQASKATHNENISNKVTQLTHRSTNSCSYRKISPIVEQHFSPIIDVQQDYSLNPPMIQSCSDIQKIAHERANEARRGHRRYDLRRGSPQGTRLQPSQAGSGLVSPTGRRNLFQQRIKQPQVLVENTRHGSCAIQQPCNYCENPDCFSAVNGVNTCCFQLLDQQQQRPTQVMKDASHQNFDNFTYQEQQADLSVDVIPEDNFWLV